MVSTKPSTSHPSKRAEGQPASVSISVSDGSTTKEPTNVSKHGLSDYDRGVSKSAEVRRATPSSEAVNSPPGTLSTNGEKSSCEPPADTESPESETDDPPGDGDAALTGTRRQAQEQALEHQQQIQNQVSELEQVRVPEQQQTAMLRPEEELSSKQVQMCVQVHEHGQI
ncbi:hypothetical protein SKAU_G00159700 [Synaphobranchus kaupii]|uniref:Uncharacterized protein n=1 Tax=Synaphobranchus kaupii TaxID=118154 RepID=A0A9Q1IZN3_SYNKA|nr:hypothetical protein SKAU_G00159700 [Synaphobranchus kaupii]